MTAVEHQFQEKPRKDHKGTRWTDGMVYLGPEQHRIRELYQKDISTF